MKHDLHLEKCIVLVKTHREREERFWKCGSEEYSDHDLDGIGDKQAGGWEGSILLQWTIGFAKSNG